MEISPIYSSPDLYRRAYPPSAEAAALCERLVAEVPGIILDAGAGTGDLAAALSIRGRRVVGVDRELSLLPRRRGVVAGDLHALPFPSATFAAVVSILFPLAYASAGEHPLRPWREVARVMRPGGLLLAEVPLAHRPHRLQGLEERAPLPAGGEYRFRYLMAYDPTPWGQVLDTEVSVRDGEGSHTLRTPLFVYTPAGLGALCAAVGLAVEGFCAPYDADSLTATPPEDCRSAVLVARRV